MRTISYLPFVIILIGGSAMAVEEPGYRVEADHGALELRLYEPVIVAETSVAGEFEDVGSEGFRRLAGFIFGGNDAGRKIAMTAPVAVERRGTPGEGTVPLSREKRGDAWIVAFTMPSSFRLEDLPVPDDARVALRQIGARRVAVVRFSGTWGEEKFREKAMELRKLARERGLVVRGEPVYARYDPPWTPSFLRRNEVLLEVSPAGR